MEKVPIHAFLQAAAFLLSKHRDKEEFAEVTFMGSQEYQFQDCRGNMPTNYVIEESHLLNSIAFLVDKVQHISQQDEEAFKHLKYLKSLLPD